jgi:hypothetical protein|tara:strand:- start:54 stop:269 length:216 start_codon:yes stop_codon:yes gene_type:complete
MRIVYREGALLVSLTDDEVDSFYNNKHHPINIGLNNLKILHEDINKAMLEAWTDNVEKKFYLNENIKKYKP